MAVDLYTHDFKFEVGDGGKYIKGEIEFNTDGKVSFKLDKTSEPLDKDVFSRFLEMTELCKKILHEFNGIKKIEFKLKD